jgi:hypothetical protein
LDVLKTILPLLSIPIGLAIAALTAWVNIAIKFAPDAAQARRETQRIFLLLLFVIGNICLIGSLVILLFWPVFSPSLSSFLMIGDCLALYSTALFWCLEKSLEPFFELHRKQIELIDAGYVKLEEQIAFNREQIELIDAIRKEQRAYTDNRIAKALGCQPEIRS